MRPHSAPAVSVLVFACLLAAGACGGPRTDETAPVVETATPGPAPSEDTAALPQITPLDYSAPETWLCRPGADDACAADASATIVAEDGKMRREAFVRASDPPIDCFYVYPTVSLDPTPNSDSIAGPEEVETARQQVARFGAACRIHAPIYRQVTLNALRQILRGGEPKTNREMAYADVQAAWRHYLANENGGRGVVLIGHSQGAGLLTRLIAAEIEGKPAQDRLVSALLIGGNLEVGANGSSGGSFQSIGLCATADQTGCAIAYSSFRADAPPVAGSLFGAASEAGRKTACVNPAVLDGSDGALKAYLPTTRIVESMSAPGPWTASGEPLETPFAATPGLLSAQCVEQDGYSYLAVTVNADAADARTDAITGDVVVDGAVQPGWGLHLIDMNLAMGNLVAIVKRQGEAWASAAQPAPDR